MTNGVSRSAAVIADVIEMDAASARDRRDIRTFDGPRSSQPGEGQVQGLHPRRGAQLTDAVGTPWLSCSRTPHPTPLRLCTDRAPEGRWRPGVSAASVRFQRAAPAEIGRSCAGSPTGGDRRPTARWRRSPAADAAPIATPRSTPRPARLCDRGAIKVRTSCSCSAPSRTGLLFASDEMRDRETETARHWVLGELPSRPGSGRLVTDCSEHLALLLGITWPRCRTTLR